jgi:tRNA threonylcarbamoyladenosine biosynthesis protein TsaE
MIYALTDLPTIGSAFAAVLRPGDVIGLSGDLGAGKTSLARAILSALGLAAEAPSPSFAIVQPYGPPETSILVLHVDLYRIDNPAEIAELGLDEARIDHALLIEWPERFGARPPADMLTIAISSAAGDTHAGTRRLTATIPAAWEGRWPFPR